VDGGAKMPENRQFENGGVAQVRKLENRLRDRRFGEVVVGL